MFVHSVLHPPFLKPMSSQDQGRDCREAKCTLPSSGKKKKEREDFGQDNWPHCPQQDAGLIQTLNCDVLGHECLPVTSPSLLPMRAVLSYQVQEHPQPS